MTRTTTLHEGWTLTAIDLDASSPAAALPPGIRATVPGTVHTDLLEAQLIEDPYIDLNEPVTAWIGHTRWSYLTRFEWTPSGAERADLVFEGLDTVATITLNGATIGSTFNQHRTYRFQAASHLREGTNELEVIFDSAWAYAEAQEAALGSLPNAYPTPFNFIRKMAANFGWDWGPQVVTAGIWKPVRLEEWSGARLAAVRPAPGFGSDGATLGLDVEIERTASASAELDIRVDVAGLSVTLIVPTGTSHTTLAPKRVEGADAWWPRGLGDPTLYDLTIGLSAGGNALDSWSRRIGFRTTTLDTSDDAEGSAFTIEVNGVPLFIRGANWIPDDCFLPRVTRERYRDRIEQAIGANLSLLRVWGGGIYESDDFYDLCDELGVMVWQDFPFACAAYPEEEPFLSEVAAEARDNITRLASHPSLVLWNGCNENIWGYFDWGWREPVEGRTWGAGFYFDVLPKIVGELSPTIPYWAGSPYSGTMEVHANEPSRGNMHIWDVWNQVDYTVYADYAPRFVSEFGFQGPPTWATLKGSIHDEPLTPESAGMLLHQKATDGNGKLERGMAPHLPEPATMDDWHYLTQLNQARAIAFGIERYRALRGHCMGTIVWQLNDCWPVTSWAAVDGYGRRKPLWHALRDANADHLVTVQPGEHGLETVLVNDSTRQWSSRLVLSRREFDGEVLGRHDVDIVVPPLSRLAVDIPAQVRDASDARRELIVASVNGARTATHFFAEDKDLELRDPLIELQLSPWADGKHQAVLLTHEVARGVALFADRLHPEAWSEEIGADVLPGEPLVFIINSPVPLNAASLGSQPVLRTVNDVILSRLSVASGGS